jgi:sporulation protein YlmC with PRC-barrel domain
MTKRTPDRSGTLIAATKVKGTVVYDLEGEKIGSVDHVMIDTTSGCAIYAVMAFGKSPGKGRKYHSLLSLPWVSMTYNAQKGGYMVNLDKKVLEDTPNQGRNSGADRPPDYGAFEAAAAAKYQDTRVRLL